MKRLSVIVPGYNTRKEWWIRCVRSIVAALGSADRVICVDDGSDVPVQSEWFEYCDGEAEIKVIQHKKNLGLPSARNTGVDAAADSQYVTFVDSDDEVRPETFTRCLAAIEKHGADLAVYGVNGLYVNDGFQVHDIPEDKYYGALKPEDVAYLVRRRLFYYSWNKVFRRAFFDEHHLRFNPAGVPCEDAIFNVGLVVHEAKWVTVAYEGYKYYRYDGSILSSYKPTYMAGTRACTQAWRDYKNATSGAYEALGSYDETSESDIIRGEWTNIWRRGSPLGLNERWNFAAEHKAELGRFSLLVFLKKAAMMWGRAHFYFRPIRRWHSKRFLTSIGAKIAPLAKRRQFVAVMNVPAPYRQHLFNELWRQLDAKGIDFHVHYMARGFKARPKSWMNPQIDFPHTYWRNWGTSEHQFNPWMLWHLIFHQPTFLICGSSFYTFTGIGVMALCRKSIRIAWVEGNAKTPGELYGWCGWVKRWILSKCQFVAAPGAQGMEYIRVHQNLTRKRLPPVVLLPNLVKETLFRPREDWEDLKIESLRNEIGCAKDDKLCFIPARFVWDKGLKEFFSILSLDMVKGWKILVLGHGPLQVEVESIISARGLTSCVVIKNSVPYEDVPIYYAAADLFLLPSVHDQNPLCVVEALHSGLPLALSDQAGNVDEAVTEGRNGWVLPVKDSQMFALKLREVFSTSKVRLAEMGRASKVENAHFWDTKFAIRNFVESVVEES